MKSPTTNSYKLPASAQFFLVQLRCIFVVSNCFFSTSVRYILATHPGGDPVFSCQLQWTHWHILTSWTPPHINSSITLTLCKIEQNMLLFASFVFFGNRILLTFILFDGRNLSLLLYLSLIGLKKREKKDILKDWNCQRCPERRNYCWTHWRSSKGFSQSLSRFNTRIWAHVLLQTNDILFRDH